MSETPKRLEFGNPEHLKIVQQGIFCICGHSKADHGEEEGRCLSDRADKECQCDDCGNWHMSENECDCSKFTLKTHRKFNVETNLFS